MLEVLRSLEDFKRTVLHLRGRVWKRLGVPDDRGMPALTHPYPAKITKMRRGSSKQMETPLDLQ